MASQIFPTSFSNENKGCMSPKGFQLRSPRAPLRALTFGRSPTPVPGKRPLPNDPQNTPIGVPRAKRPRNAPQPPFTIFKDPELGPTVPEQAQPMKELGREEQNPPFWVEIPKLSLPKSAYPPLPDLSTDIPTTGSRVAISSTKKAPKIPSKWAKSQPNDHTSK